MCVGVPAKVMARDEFAADVDVMGTRMKVGILFVPDVSVGDYVIVHAGQAMSVIDERFALESLEEWRKLVDARNAEPAP